MTERKSGPGVPFNKSFWILLLFGVLIHFVAIDQPLIDAHLVRQAQTADWTYHALREPGFPLSAEVSWRGDTHARLALEFPLFNYVVLAITKLIPSLDAAGKIAAILFWAGSFAILQQIWTHLLTSRQAFWANFLFVLSPLSVFFGQAFMPEMCIQFLAFSMLYGLLRYGTTGALRHYLVFAGAGLLGLLVKSLEISHLYAVALIVFWQRERARLFLKPHHWIGGIITLACLLAWTHYVDRVNQVSFPEWTASELSRRFLGTFRQRLDWHFYFKVVAYLAAFAAGPIGLVIAVFGARQANSRNSFGFWWLGSLIFFYLVWGMETAGLHSYYNLPALGPLCFLFGLGFPAVLDAIGTGVAGVPVRAAVLRYALLSVVVLPLIGCSMYLFRQDRTIYEAAVWIRNSTVQTDLVTLRLNHRIDINDYPEFPVFSYYAKRGTWVDTTKRSESERQHAFATAAWAVMTFPPIASTWAEKVRDKIRRYQPLERIPDWPRAQFGFDEVQSDDRFAIYRKNLNGAKMPNLTTSRSASPLSNNHGASESAHPGPLAVRRAEEEGRETPRGVK